MLRNWSEKLRAKFTDTYTWLLHGNYLKDAFSEVFEKEGRQVESQLLQQKLSRNCEIYACPSKKVIKRSASEKKSDCCHVGNAFLSSSYICKHTYTLFILEIYRVAVQLISSRLKKSRIKYSEICCITIPLLFLD